MQIPPINANFIIIAVLVVSGLYGLAAGKQRLRILILSVYVGIVLAEQMSSLVGITAKMLGADQVSFLLLGLPILVFGFIGIGYKKNHAKGAAIANIIVGFLTGGLIVSSALKLLPVSELTAVDSDSFIAMTLQQYHLYILGLLPVIALVLGLLKGEKHKG